MDERKYLRNLLSRIVEISAAPAAKSALNRFRQVNQIEPTDRAPVWCRPVGCWTELVPESALECRDPNNRQWEMNFRRQLVKHDIGDDEIFLDYLPVEAVIDVDPPNTWGVEIGRTRPAETGGAWSFNPPIKTQEDLCRLAAPEYTFNAMATAEKYEKAAALFEGIAEIRTECNPGFDHATLCARAAELLGLEQMMVSTVLDPPLVHAVMAHARDAKLRQLEAMEASGLLTDNAEAVMLCHNPVQGTAALADTWTAGNSQEFDQVSPQAFDEFLLAYQKPIFKRFRHVAYGCCESLNSKLDLVLTIPNLRIVVCSAWTDMNLILRTTSPDKHCIMWRQKATDVVFADDISTIKRDLEEGCKRLQGRSYQIILRELQTLNGNFDRLHIWADLAKEAASKFS